MKVKCYRTSANQNTDVLDAHSIRFENKRAQIPGWHPAKDTVDNYVAINLKDGTARLKPQDSIIEIWED